MTAVQSDQFTEATAHPAPLVVILHAFNSSPDRLQGIRSASLEAYGDCSLYTPRLPFTRPLTTVPPERIAASLVDAIDELVERVEPSRIVLVGHSMSSVLARKVAVLAHGEFKQAPFEPLLEEYGTGRPWAQRIERLVLLAGMARGWSITAAHDWFTATWWTILTLIGDIIFNGRWTILAFRVGSPFMVQTRLQWLALTRELSSPIATVQLLGSRDDTVAPDDAIDLAIDLKGEWFALIDLPNTDHQAAVDLLPSGNDDPAKERRRRFVAALTRSIPQLQDEGLAVRNDFIGNGGGSGPDAGVTDVLFVIHGIRDRGFWTQKVARKVMQEADAAGRVVREMTRSYGYLAMGPFVLPWVRRAKVRWLMDRYADMRANYPYADFFYVGHSNGTYLAARALQDYPAARWKRIVFAGSVVRRQYDWQQAITGPRRQVDAVLNYVASGDWVVAIFPNGLSRLPRLDLGSAGHHGFSQLRGSAPRPGAGAAVSSVPIGAAVSHQVDYIDGGHSAGIKESQWDDIARFIVHGDPPQATDPDYVPHQRPWAVMFGLLPPVWLLLVAAAVLGVAFLLCLVAWQYAGPFWGTLVVVACSSLLYLLVTRV